MEIFFWGQYVQTETLILFFFGGIIFLILSTYFYAYIRRIIRTFWPHKRDAILSARNQELLKKRELEEQKRQIEQKDLPPPLTIEEIEEKQEEIEERNENFEEENVSGDISEISENNKASTETEIKSENSLKERSENSHNWEAEEISKRENSFEIIEQESEEAVSETKEAIQKDKDIENAFQHEEKNNEEIEENWEKQDIQTADVENIEHKEYREKNPEHKDSEENIISENENNEIETISETEDNTQKIEEYHEIETISKQIEIEEKAENLEETTIESILSVTENKDIINEFDTEDEEIHENSESTQTKNIPETQENIEKGDTEENTIIENIESPEKDTEEISENFHTSHENISENEMHSNETIEHFENFSEEWEEISDKKEIEENIKTEEKLEDSLEETGENPDFEEKNPENIFKTFDEIEQESDKNFETSEENTDENENPLEEIPQTQEFIENTGKAISEIIEKEEEKIISPNYSEKLFELTSIARTQFARGDIAATQATIIEWLSLKKDHKELNLLLGTIYENNNDFAKAEMIYKDLALNHTEDEEILKRLADVLIITRKFPIAYELYKKITTLTTNTEDALYITAHLARELEDFSDVYKYCHQYLKQWPNNKEILTLLSEAEIILGKRKEAIETLSKLKKISPYNTSDINALIEKLITEEEILQNSEK